MAKCIATVPQSITGIYKGEKVRAKFSCYSEERAMWGTTTYKLRPVSGTCKENEDFFRTTPAGDISITVKEDETNARLSLGSDYYIEFVKVLEG